MLKFLLIMVVLAGVSGGAMAEWVVIDQTENFTSFIDPATIRRSGDMVKMWDMNDYKYEQSLATLKFLSIKILHEYDCKEEKVRKLYTSFHPNHLSEGGRVFDTSEPNNWRPIPPDTTIKAMWKFACGKP